MGSFPLFKIFAFFAGVGWGAHPRHIEVPKLGVELELQLLAYTTATAMPDLSLSATYTTAHGNARSLTY